MLEPIQRRIHLGIIAATAIIPVPLLAIFLLEGDLPGILGSAIGLLVNGALLLAYTRGWQAARHVLVVAATLIIGFALTPNALTVGVHPLIFMAPALALVLTSWPWVVGTGVTVYGLALFRAGFRGIYVTPEMLMSVAIVVTTLVLSRLAMDHAYRSIEQRAAEAREEAKRAAEALALVRQQAEDLARRNEEQERLLNLVATLETPAITIAEGMLIAPIVGHFDNRRAQAFTTRLLAEVSAQHARLLILDVSGVAMIDSGVATALERLIQSIHLLGCEVTMTGIKPAVANTLTGLGMSFTNITTARTPQQVLNKVGGDSHRG